MAVVAAATPSAGVRSGAYKPPLSDSERRRIIEAAQEEIKAKGDQATRRGAFRRAYPDFSPSGERYAQFGAVLNEEGLLTKASSPSLPSAREMINTA
jgi:hypothetical protein